MIFAAIDIGSNAGRLLIGKIIKTDDKIFTEKVSLVRVPLRLGLDVFEKGYITPERQEFLIRTFTAYQKLMNVFDPIDMIACGTSAMREATNGQQVIESIKRETGVNLHIIDGELEARIISSVNNYNMVKKFPHSLYIDVGGGSTDLSWFEGDTMISTRSFCIGTIRLLYDQVSKEEWDGLKAYIQELNINGNEVNCICSGGNINKLAKLFGNSVNNTLSQSQLADGYSYLEGFSVEDRITKMGLRPDRADVIVPAAMIFKKIMKWAEIHELQAPKFGLADGLLVDLYHKHMGEPTIIA